LEEQDVASAIATMTGIPVSQLVAREAKRLRDLEKHLRRYIIGQEEAIAAVARSIRRSRSGISSTKRPISSFIFMGPTGVGKTELSKVLAREVFGSEKALIKIDMSEFGDRHTAARLIGAPAGYVGYDDSNQLTDKVRRQPYSVILFDEIEKAHPDVLQLLLQILEDGSLTDGKGRHVNFSHSVIILTSNIGAEAMQKEASLGFRAQSKKDTDDLRDLHERNSDVARDRLKQIMRPELINRFDNIIVFKALTKREIRRILDVLMTDLQERLMAKGLRVVLSSAAKNMLIEKGYDEFNGARPLRRAIEDLVEHPIAEGVLSDTFTPGSVLEATVKNNHIVVSLKKEE
jgi:ATP-dependent Clp protease ATP-binding subunit ClpC